ncbi:hypothetical protein HPP92_008348 [Vanilla planifolia]|nr:hypothetical protein HPP92_008348 [Vanilla planifolia]
MSASQAAASESNPIHCAPPSLTKGNRLLAGYLAHEFLTKGTLLGNRWGQARPEPSTSGRSTGAVRTGLENETSVRSLQAVKAYAELAHLLKTDGVHVPGVVNPTQLAKWLQM